MLAKLKSAISPAPVAPVPAKDPAADTWRRVESLTAERDKLGDRIQANLESLTADLIKLADIGDEMRHVAPDVYSWGLCSSALATAFGRAMVKARFNGGRSAHSGALEFATFAQVVRDGSTAVLQRKPQ